MRRLAAYLIMMFTIIGAVVFNTQVVLESKNDGMEFGKGTQLVYSINKRDATKYDNELYPDIASEGTKDLKDIDIESVFMERLDLAGVRNADVSIINGNPENNVGYQLKVTLSPLTESELKNVRTVVEMTGSVSVCTLDDDCMTYAAGDFFNTDRIADVNYVGTTPYPTLNISSSEDIETMKTKAKEAAENHKDDVIGDDDDEENGNSDSSTASFSLAKSPILREGTTEGGEGDGNGDGETTDPNETKLYLWMNKTVDDTYEKAFGINEQTVVQECRDKVIGVIDLNNYNAETKTLPLVSDVEGNAYNIPQARALVNALNAADYGFDINYLYRNTVDPFFGSSGMNNAYIFLIAAFLLISVLLILFFGISSLSAIATMLGSCFVSLLVFIAMGFEFSIAGIMGLIVIMLLSAFLSSNYFTRVKAELNKADRKLDKANREGYHKAFFLGLDVAAVVLICSVFPFLFASGHFQTFFGMIMLGTIFTFLITNYFNKWMLYWLCKNNDTKRPNIYFSLVNFKKKDKEVKKVKLVSTEKKHFSKVTAIAVPAVSALILALALPISNALGGDGYSLFNNKDAYANTYTLNIEYKNSIEKDEELATKGELLNFIEEAGKQLEEVGLYTACSADDPNAKNADFVYYPETAYVNIIKKKNEEGEIYYANYLTVNVNKDLSTVKASETNALQVLTTAFEEGEILLDDGELATPGLSSHYTQGSMLVGCYLTTPTDIAHITNNFFLIIFLIPLFASIYALIRYGMNVALAELASGTTAAILVIGIMSAFRFPFNAFTSYAPLVFVIIILMMTLATLANNKVIAKEHKKDPSFDELTKTELVNDTSYKNLPMLLMFSSITLVVSLMLLIIDPAIYGMSALFAVSSLFIIPFLLFFAVPLYHLCFTHISFKKFSKRYNEFMAKHSKKDRTVKVDSKDGIVYVDQDITHETIIPGMNDFRR